MERVSDLGQAVQTTPGPHRCGRRTRLLTQQTVAARGGGVLLGSRGQPRLGSQSFTVHRAGPQSGAQAETPWVICRTPVPSTRITTTFADLAKVIHFPSGEKEPVTTTFPG